MQIKLKIFLIIIIHVNILFFGSSLSEEIDYQHGIAMHGDLKYEKDLRNLIMRMRKHIKAGKLNFLQSGPMII